MWIDDVFICDPGVEGLGAFRRLLDIDHLDIDDFSDGRSSCLPVVLQHRRLAGVEGIGLCLQIIVTLEFQLGVRAAGSAS